MTDKHDLNRRDFIKAATAFVGGLISMTIGIPAIAYLLSPSLRKTEDESVVNLGPLEKYPIGIPTLFEFTRTKVNGWERTGISYGVFVLRQSGKDVRVFSDICTHLACRVTWHSDQQHYISPCHDGHFDIMGNNVSGPPPRPLDEFVTKIEDGNLYIQLPAFKRTS
ncbi:MAG: ubiquinol-cytochrome c reductase iron-sulfur subunit [Chloroflexi bacterium]|nr:ubiquinol-cytochrome c reductase iron-sulfur subunit [Chloroflexota bacterium]